MARHQQKIVIIGGGFSGTVLAANLLRCRARHRLHVVLVERCPQLGGVAYATREFPHLLNVPAGRMSADSRDPAAFLDFARRRAADATPEDFLPRAWYGEYLRSMLDEAERNAPPEVSFERVVAEATGITRTLGDGSLRIECAGGRVLAADQVVLAAGNPPPATLPGLELLASHPRYVREACSDAQREPLHGEVLLIGTGLTMADATLAATGQGVKTIHAISRHGLVPLAQVAGHGGVLPADALPQTKSVRTLLRAARQLAQGPGAGSADWREVVNAIRERAPQIWHGLDEAQRRRFLRHVRPYWDVHRHRLPPSTFQRLQVLQQAGRLHVHAARIIEARPEGGKLRVMWRPRGEGRLLHLKVDWILNYTGPDYDLRRTQDPLLRSACRAGLAVADDCGLGLRTGRHGALIDAAGHASTDLYCLGPMLRADHWETTAVAELRRYAESLAAHLAAVAARGVAPSQSPALVHPDHAAVTGAVTSGYNPVTCRQVDIRSRNVI